jgi:hypothetical protein
MACTRIWKDLELERRLALQQRHTEIELELTLERFRTSDKLDQKRY